MIYNVTVDQPLAGSRQPIAMTDPSCHRKQVKRKGTSLLKIIRSASRLTKTSKPSANCVLHQNENNESERSGNKDVMDGVKDIDSNLSIVKWNSFESLEEDDSWSSRQNASLRRSRASLIFPTAELDPRGRPKTNNYGNRATSRRIGVNDKGVLRYNSVNTLSDVKCTTNRLPCNQKSFSTQELQSNEKLSGETGSVMKTIDTAGEWDNEVDLSLSCDDSNTSCLSLPNVNERMIDKRRGKLLALKLKTEKDVCRDDRRNQCVTCREESLESPISSIQDYLFVHEDAAIERTHSSNSDYVVLESFNEPEQNYRVYKFQPPHSPLNAPISASPLVRNESNVFSFKELPSTIDRQLSDQGDSKLQRSPSSTTRDSNNSQTFELNPDSILRNSLGDESRNVSKQFELRRSKSYSQVYKRQSSRDNNLKQLKQNRKRERIRFKKRLFRSRSETDLKKRSREQLKQTMFIVRNTTSCRSLFIDDQLSLSSSDDCQRGRRPRSISAGSNYLWDDEFPVAFAEAVLDCNSLNPLELSFLCGDVIAVYSMDDPSAWWGKNKGEEGWFSPSFVRVRISQIIEEDEIEAANLTRMHSIDDEDTSHLDNLISGHVCIETERAVSPDIRSKCIRELVTSEREYVKTLKDVIEGYYFQMKEKDEMFNDPTINTIFSNILNIFTFHKQFLEELKLVAALSIGTNYYQSTASIDKTDSGTTESNNNNSCNFPASIGGLFEKHRQDFEIYSDYCNNHPYACMKIIELQKDEKYQQFFEACRLRQNMINISLDGFLLTPVQKICKYPLQLKELLKHTSVDHEDYGPVKRAWQAMRDVASLINERKRGVENISQLAQWQLTVFNWKGRDLTEVSSELIYKGKSNLTLNEKTISVQLFLFDHQLIICAPDSLDKSGLAYFDRINLDMAEHSDRPSSEDCRKNPASPSCSWKIHVPSEDAWYLFTVDSQEKQCQWSRAFERERSRVADQSSSDGLVIPMNVRRTAIELARKQKDTGDLKKRPQRKSMVLLPIIVDTPKTTQQKKIIRKLSFDYGMFSRKNRRQARKESNNSLA